MTVPLVAQVERATMGGWKEFFNGEETNQHVWGGMDKINCFSCGEGEKLLRIKLFLHPLNADLHAFENMYIVCGQVFKFYES